MDNVFVGQTVSDEGIVYTSLYGVDEAGQTHLIFDPNADRLQATGYGDIIPGSFVVMDDELYFQVAYASGLGAEFVSTSYLVRLDMDGVVHLVEELPEGLTLNTGSQGLDPVDTIIATPDGLVMSLFEPVPFGVPSVDIWSYSDTDGFAVEGDFTRTGYTGASGGMAYVGDTLFTIADQQTPQNVSELWRVTSGGVLEVVWFRSDQSVYDLEAFNGEAWFITGLTSMGISQNLWHVTETGAAQSVTLASTVSPLFLDVDAGGLHMVYSVPGGGGVQLAQIDADGTLTDLLAPGEMAFIFDVIAFDGAIYFCGVLNDPGAVGEQIFRLESDGTLTAIPNLVDGVSFDLLSTAPGFAVGEDQLYFTASMQVDDGFGGSVSRLAYLGLAPDGTVTLISGGVADTLDPAPVAFVGGISFGFELGAPVVGSDESEALEGTQLSEVISGLGGNDTLSGLNGNDVLDGGSGNDTMVGNAGNDTYVVDATGDEVFETTTTATLIDAGGNDLVNSAISFSLDTSAGSRFVEELTLTGSAAINGTGNALANRLTGNSGNNVLNGAGGADVMLGGAGNDTYVADGGDTITENASQGTDTVQSSVSFTLGANLENLVLTGSAAINGTGNSAANRLTGNSGNNVLNGASGSDVMLGDAGNDTYIVNGGDTITENASQGTDTVQSSVTFMLGANLENLLLTGSASINGTGNTLANRLTGNNGNNVLNGAGGSDVMLGGAGNDTYVTNGGDTITENANQGTDTVQSSVSLTLGANIERLTLTGSAAINGTGNTLANTITGNTGANTLNGAAGSDTLTGGTGSDSFVFNAALGSSNIDRITDYNVAADTIRIENAVFTGLAGGTLSAAAFVRNTSGNAADASDRVIYESDTGRLYFDRDGTGAAAKVHFATIGTNLAVTNADFLVF